MLNPYENQHAGYRQNEADTNVYQLQDNQRRRRIVGLIFLLIWPMYMLLFLLAYALKSVASAPGKQWLHSLLIRYYKRYYALKSVQSYITVPIEQVKTPTLFLTNRYDDMVPAFVSTVLNTPLVLPLGPSQQKTSFLTPALKVVSYPDGALHQTLPVIKHLLENGYHVLAYINDVPSDPRTEPALYSDGSLSTLLNWDVQTYFLLLDGYHRVAISTVFRPSRCRCDLMPKSDLFKYLLTESDEEKLQKVASFFRFRRVRPLSYTSP